MSFFKNGSLVETVTTTATAAGTTTLTVSSTVQQQFTGTTTQTVVLPDATTLPKGRRFYIMNRSTGSLTVNYNGGSLAKTVSANTEYNFVVIDNATTAGTWDVSNGSGGGGFAEDATFSLKAGTNALATNSTSQYDIALGYNAGRYITGSSTTGSNIALGFSALQGSSGGGNTGTHNFAAGNSALIANTSGSNGIAIGNSALTANTSGSNNIALGPQALNASVSTPDSIAIGNSAQKNMKSTSGRNIALGYQTMQGSATPANNTGSYNVAIGDSAMILTTSGAHNQGIGDQSLYNLNSGTYNFAGGYSALSYVTSGANNVGVGVNSGVTGTSANALTTGSRNTYLGYNSGPSTSTQISDAVAIGSGAVAAGTYDFVAGSNSHKFKVPGAALVWDASRAYAVGALVAYGNILYQCVTAHTSNASTMEPDIALGYWVIVKCSPINQNLVLVGGNFEDADTGGWQLFNTTLTSGIPTGALTLGSATGMSVAVTSTNPLSGKYSLQVSNTASTNFAAGSGIISQVYNVDSVFQAKALANRFAFQATTGASFQNYSGTSSNTWAVYIYDVTNSVWIQPAGVYNLTQSTGVGIHNGTWQSPSNMTQFRLALVCINSTTGSSPAVNTIQTTFDDFYVGPQVSVQGTPIGDWQLDSNLTPTNFGTVTNSTLRSRRVGDTIEVSGYWQSGTAVASTASINISGKVIDTTKLGSQASITVVGQWTQIKSASGATGIYGSGYSGQLFYDGSTNNNIYFATATESNVLDKANGSGVTDTNGWVFVYFRIPILGWSSNSVMSADTDTRMVAAIISGDPASAASGNPIIVPTVGYDSHGSYNATTGRYTAPIAGIYKMYGALQSASSATTLTIYKNASSSALAGNLDSNGEATFCAAVQCAAGDIIDLRPGGTVDATSMTLNIERLSGPSVIASTESVNARFTCSTSPSISSGSATIINMDTKSYDTHGAVTTGASWKYTAPISGKYSVKSMISYDSTAWTVGTTIRLYLYKNGSLYSELNRQVTQATFTQPFGLQGTDDIQLVAGDYIDIRTDQNLGSSASLRNEAGVNYVAIARIGN